MKPTLLLTGATGFIAKHIALRLLNAGYRVRGSLRRMDRAEEVRAALRGHLLPGVSLDKLTFVPLDLCKAEGWEAAMAGVDAVVHTASPFPMHQPNEADDLIRPAVEGALHCLRAAHAAGVARVVMTSSAVAVAGGGLRDGRISFDEQDWTDADDPASNPYTRSKTLAERAAWDFVAQHAPEIGLTVINPGLVLGPPLDVNYGTSLRVIERLLAGKDPMLPRLGFAIVDVRDVAEAHLRALERPATVGRRYLVTERSLWVRDMALAIKTAFPQSRVATRVAPDFLIRFLGLFDPALRGIVPGLGRIEQFDNSRARAELGLTFRTAREAVVAAAAAVLDHQQRLQGKQK